jgi:hypothetical protein
MSETIDPELLDLDYGDVVLYCGLEHEVICPPKWSFEHEIDTPMACITPSTCCPQSRLIFHAMLSDLKLLVRADPDYVDPYDAENEEDYR